jgi:hypothetical protein
MPLQEISGVGRLCYLEAIFIRPLQLETAKPDPFLVIHMFRGRDFPLLL